MLLTLTLHSQSLVRFFKLLISVGTGWNLSQKIYFHVAHKNYNICYSAVIGLRNWILCFSRTIHNC